MRYIPNKHILCIQDHYDGFGEKVLEAGKIYPYVEHLRSERDPGCGDFYNVFEQPHIFRHPISVETMYGKIRLDQDTADNVVTERIHLAEYIRICCDLSYTPPGPGQEYGTYTAYAGDVSMQAEETGRTVTSLEPGSQPWKRYVSALIGRYIDQVDRGHTDDRDLDTADTIHALRFLEALQEMPCDEDLKRTYETILGQKIMILRQKAAERKMSEAGIDPIAAQQAFYEDYLNEDILPKSLHVEPVAEEREDEEDLER